MNNLDRYYDESRKHEDNKKCFFFQKRTGLPGCGDDTYNCEHYFEDTIKWLLQDCEGPITYGNKFKYIEKQRLYDDEFKDQDVIYARVKNPKYPSPAATDMYFFTAHGLQSVGLGFNTYYTLKGLGL